jgi:hypothetical protein
MRSVNRVPSPMIATGAPGAAGGWRVLTVTAILTLAALGAYWNSFNVPLLLDDALAIEQQPVHPPSRADRRCALATDHRADRRAAAAQPDICAEFRRGRPVRARVPCGQSAHSCLRRARAAGDRASHAALPGLRHRYGEAALPLAAFAALLWTLHPLQTEAVTYISQRAESLMGLFYLLTLVWFHPVDFIDVGRDRRRERAPSGAV